MPSKRAAPRFEIWEAGERIHSVDNPVRLKLLRLLEERPRRLPDLVRLTGKAKSTLSELHVRPLVELGLVSEETDPKDSRSKVYRLRAQRLGSSEVDVPRLRASVLAYASRAIQPPAADLLRLVDPPGLVASGAEPAYVDSLAERLGRILGEGLRGRAPEAVVGALDVEVQKAKLGSLQWAAGRVRVEAQNQDVRRFLERLCKAAIDAAGA